MTADICDFQCNPHSYVECLTLQLANWMLMWKLIHTQQMQPAPSSRRRSQTLTRGTPVCLFAAFKVNNEAMSAAVGEQCRVVACHALVQCRGALQDAGRSQLGSGMMTASIWSSDTEW